MGIGLMLLKIEKSQLKTIYCQLNNMGVTCGPGYPLIRLQALRSLAGIRYYP
jgi:hypothetical protein